MKKVFAILFFSLILGCGNTPSPTPVPPPLPPVPVPVPIPVPPPVPVTVFEVSGLKIAIKAQMKPGAKVSLEEMRAAVRATVAQLEGTFVEDVTIK